MRSRKPKYPFSSEWPLVGRLGAGGQGTTWAVRRTGGSGGDTFVLKTLGERHQGDEQRRRRMHAESDALRKLTHHAIPRWVASNTELWGDRAIPLFMVMERVEGETLHSAVSRGPIAEEGAIRLTVAVLAALEHAHERQVGHRDIKPKNIVLRCGQAEAPVVVDFGLSFNTEAEDNDLTRTGEEVGNRFLMLPELWLAGSRRDFRSDVAQACGLLTYALTGVEPKVLRDHQGNPPHRRSSVADDLAQLSRRSALFELLDAGFAWEVDRRPTAQAARMQLEEVLRGTSAAVDGTTRAVERIHARMAGDQRSIARAAAPAIFDAIFDALIAASKRLHMRLPEGFHTIAEGVMREPERQLASAVIGNGRWDGVRFAPTFRIALLGGEVRLDATTGGESPRLLVGGPVQGFILPRAFGDQLDEYFADGLDAVIASLPPRSAGRTEIDTQFAHRLRDAVAAITFPIEVLIAQRGGPAGSALQKVMQDRPVNAVNSTFPDDRPYQPVLDVLVGSHLLDEASGPGVPPGVSWVHLMTNGMKHAVKNCDSMLAIYGARVDGEIIGACEEFRTTIAGVVDIIDQLAKAQPARLSSDVGRSYFRVLVLACARANRRWHAFLVG